MTSAILTVLGVVAVGSAFFAVWMQLFAGGKVGGRLLLLSALSGVGAWILIWAIFPTFFG